MKNSSLILLVLLLTAVIFTAYTYMEVRAKFVPSYFGAAAMSPVKPNGEINFHSRFGYHMADSLDVLNKIKNKYSSIEFDVFYANGFWVAHNEREADKVYLETWLSASEPLNKNFWLDLKTENLSAAQIDELFSIFLKQNFPLASLIVETPTPGLSRALRERGFFTALQVHDYSNPKEVEERLNLARASAISCSISKYMPLVQMFPNMDLIVYYKAVNPLKKYWMKKRLLSNPHVKLILLN